MIETPQQRSVIIAVTLTSFLAPFMGSSINVALPAMGREFAAGAVTLAWVTSSFILASAIFLVPLGRVADMHGRTRMFKAGIIIFTLSSLACGFSPSIYFLVAMRFIQGGGSAMIYATAVPVLVSAFPPQYRGRVIGINAATVYLGLSLGPFAGGFLTHFPGWRSIFITCFVLGVYVMWRVRHHLGNDVSEKKGGAFDGIGSVLYSISLVCVMYGFSRLPALWALALTAAGLAGFTVFIVYERGISEPVLHVSLFRENRVFALSNLSALINYGATFAVTFLLSMYLQYVRGYTPAQAGMILVVQPALMALFSPVAGRLSDRVEPRRVASAGMGLATLGLSVFCFLDHCTPMAYIIASLGVLGVGFALFASPNTNAILGSVEPARYGIASGTLGTMRLVGQMLSMGIAMMIISLFVGRGAVTGASTDLFLASFHWAFIVFALMCFIGIWTSLARGRVNKTAG